MIDIIYLYPLIIGFLLDTIIGDPYALPHPIRWFGNAISAGERHLNKGNHRFAKGAFLTVFLVGGVFALLSVVTHFLKDYNLAFLIFASLGLFYGIANHSLIKEGLKVIHELKKEGLEAGRKQLSFIVGRDTSKLNEHEIRIAVLETLAENLSDGVIAPLFYYALAGVPGILAYKMANTLDSMIGYKSERYKDFGCFAARFDDVLNFIPARITAFLMVLVTASWRGAMFIIRYGRKHSSPNAGYPESALAGILNCRFGGPNVYHGKLVDKPFIGENARPILHNDVVKASIVNFVTSTVFVGILAALFYFYG